MGGCTNQKKVVPLHPQRFLIIMTQQDKASKSLVINKVRMGGVNLLHSIFAF